MRRLNISLPAEMQRELRLALARRFRLARQSGQITAVTISGWVREMAQKTIASFK